MPPSLPAFLPPQIPPNLDGKPFQEPARLDNRQNDTDRRRGEDPDEGNDDPGGEEAAREDVVGEEHRDWDLQFPLLGWDFFAGMRGGTGDGVDLQGNP
jgi:hypothetical protein